MHQVPVAHCVLLLVIAGSGVHAPAQAVRALPRSATDAYAGSAAFAIPTTAFRAQYWFAQDNLPPVQVVNAIGVRIARNAASTAQSRRIEVTVADTPVAFAAVNATFASNLGPSPVTFLAPRTIAFPAVTASADPNVAAAWFPGDAPFVHVAQHFAVDFRAGASTGGALVRNDGLVMAPGATETLHLAGRASCGGLLTGAWSLGTFTLNASGLPAGAVASFNLGLENVEENGLRLPLDLGVIGMPGCQLGVIPLVAAHLPANASGVATLVLNLAAPTGTSVMLSTQVVHPRVPLPLTIADWGTTNAVHSTFGYQGLCNALFAGSDVAITSTQGPQPVNNSIVLLLL
ncbi:MAG: hypothetical protein HZB39_21700 [Planctomycetes bacterium]|nr:hypothetical protein [Planctomycetota bacterium]